MFPCRIILKEYTSTWCVPHYRVASSAAHRCQLPPGQAACDKGKAPCALHADTAAAMPAVRPATYNTRVCLTVLTARHHEHRSAPLLFPRCSERWSSCGCPTHAPFSPEHVGEDRMAGPTVVAYQQPCHATRSGCYRCAVLGHALWASLITHGLRKPLWPGRGRRGLRGNFRPGAE
jgi:hypothetical protein